jgi:hypothetical protein
MSAQDSQIPALYTQAIKKYREITNNDFNVTFLHKL